MWLELVTNTTNYLKVDTAELIGKLGVHFDHVLLGFGRS